MQLSTNEKTHMTRQFRITIAASALKASVAAGWAASISEGFETMGELSDWEPGITMNEALLTGIIRCLLEVPIGSEVEIVSNNAYIIDGLGKYLLVWRSNGWKKADGKPIAYKELWQQVDALLLSQHAIKATYQDDGLVRQLFKIAKSARTKMEL